MKDEYDELIQEAVNEYLRDVDWRLYKAQLWQESRLNPDAVSPVGARGIAQFMPDTWSEWTARLGLGNAGPEDPEASIIAGAAYMQYLIDEWNWPRPWLDRYCLALASYNAGLGNVLDAQKSANMASLYREIIARLPDITGEHSRETLKYVRHILRFYAAQVID